MCAAAAAAAAVEGVRNTHVPERKTNTHTHTHTHVTMPSSMVESFLDEEEKEKKGTTNG